MAGQFEVESGGYKDTRGAHVPDGDGNPLASSSPTGS